MFIKIKNIKYISEEIQVEIQVKGKLLSFFIKGNGIKYPSNIDGVIYMLLQIGMLLNLDIDANGYKISKNLVENIAKIQKIYLESYPDLNFKIIKLINYKLEKFKVRKWTKSNIGAFFSLGVDSHYTLLKNLNIISNLIFIKGFDIRLKDKVLYSSVTPHFDNIKTKFKIETVVIETNIRELTDKYIEWEPIHGLCLIGIANLLSKNFSKILISSSGTIQHSLHSGVNQNIDPLVSNKNLKIETYGYNISRLNKLRTVSISNCVNSIRVCWKNLDNTFNCGRCKKCILNRLALSVINEKQKLNMFYYPNNLLLKNLILNNDYDLEYLEEILSKSNKLDKSLDEKIRRIIDKYKLHSEKKVKVIKWKRLKPCLFVDFNGVISNNKFWHTISNKKHKLYKYHSKIENYLFINNRHLITDWMTGKYTSNQIHIILEKETGVPSKELFEIFISEAKNIDISINILNSLKKLKNHYYIIMVTDNMDSFNKYTLPANPLLGDTFDEIINSYDTKKTKIYNNGKIFKDLCKKYQAEIEKSILIDDSLKNCDLFKKLGGISKISKGEIEALKSIKEINRWVKTKWLWQY